MKRAGSMVMAIVLLLLGVAALIFGDLLPQRPRPGPPAIAHRTLIAHEPHATGNINLAAGMGTQLIAVGNDLWVCYIRSDAAGSSAWVTHSANAGQTFTDPVEASALLGVPRVTQGSLALNEATGTLWLAVTTRDPLAPRGATGTTSIAVLQSDDFGKSWALALPPLEAETDNQSLSNPVPLPLPDGLLIFLRETRDREHDALRVWRALPEGSRAILPVDDDPTGAPKLGYSVALAGETVHVAYTDGRLSPGSSLHLYVTRAPAATLEFAPSSRLDPPEIRSWQSAPHLIALPDGTLLLSATRAIARFQPAAFRDKLQRHRVAGLSQVKAWSREPVLWRSENGGQTWSATGGWTRYESEVRSHAVQVAHWQGQTALAWLENRPVTRHADVRWSWQRDFAVDPTESAVVNVRPDDLIPQELYGIAVTGQGQWLMLYRDAPAGQPHAHELWLARIAPMGAQSDP